MTEQEVMDNMVWISLKDKETFLIIMETLTRIGIPSYKNSTLYQSCHILHKQGKYAITHFKEMFALDGKPANFDENDLLRRKAIANLLVEWKLCSLVNEKRDAMTKEEIKDAMKNTKIIHAEDKADWNLVAKYTIGKKKKDETTTSA